MRTTVATADAAGCARPRGRCVCGRHRCERRHRQVRGRRRRGLLRADERARAEAVRDDDALRAERSDRRSRTATRSIARSRSRSSPGSRSSLAVYPYPPREVEDGTATPAAFATWLTLVAQRYPTVKQFIVMNEPNQPAFVRPQFGPTGKNVSAAQSRGVPRRRLRRAQGGRPGDPRDRARPLAARQRPADRDEQRLDLAGAVPRRARGVVPLERPHAAADGRAQLPPVSRPGDRPARPRLPLAEGGLRKPRPDQAGRLGRVPGHAAADDRERAASCTSTRSAGRSTRRR